ncbi:Ig-like domain-containing protein [Maribacter sp. X9]|uniref:Ig-like domain-containing protein n=1 Tax=Maribacter sp. X9 TaxID=3402159 RepID=UPI003AF384EF
MKKNHSSGKGKVYLFSFYLFFTIIFGAVCQSPASPDIREIAKGGAWNWSMDERAVFHNGYLFVGYALSDGRVGITRYNPITNEKSESIISTTNSQQRDDHVAPSITILSDGRLLAMHTRHLGHEFFYRISNNTTPRNNGDWGPEIKWDLNTTNLFSNTYALSNENNSVYNFYRGINDNPTVSISRDDAATWEDPIQLIRTTGDGLQRPYPKFATDGLSRIDFTYTDGHPRITSNSIYHLYYENGSFYRSNGSFFKSFQNLPIQHDNGERGTVVYQFSTSPWQNGQNANDYIPNAPAWTWDMAYQADGKPVTVFQASLDSSTEPNNFRATRIFYYYARWTGTTWQKRMIAKAGRSLYDKEMDYSGGIAIDPDNPNVVYISTNAQDPFDLRWEGTDIALNTNERYEIWKGITNDNGLTFSWEPITQNSSVDNLRPIVPKNHGQDQHAIWFRGRYSSYEGDWNTDIVGLFGNTAVKTVTGVSLSPGELSLPVDGSSTLTATVSPSDATDRSVVWGTSDPSIATVDANGRVTAVGVGSATVTVTTVDGGYSATTEVMVVSRDIPVSGVSLSPGELSLPVDGSSTLTATVSPSDATDRSVVWDTSDPSIATVDANGRVTGVSEGSVTVTVTTVDGGYRSTTEVTVVSRDIPVSGVSLSPGELSLPVDGSSTLTATVSPSDATDRSVVWETSDPSIATVDANGRVTAVGVGSATVTVTTVDGGYRSTTEVTVVSRDIPVSGVSLSPGELSLPVDGSSTLTATVSPSDATDRSVVWGTSDPSIATVDANGRVTAVGVGSATVTVTTVDGNYSASAALTVVSNYISLSGISLSPGELSLSVDGSSTLTATVSPSDATDRSVVWETSDPSIVTVDSNGTVTGVSEGSATVTVTTVDGNISATATIIVTDIVMLIAPNPATSVLYLYFYSPEPMDVNKINIYDNMGRFIKAFNDPTAILLDDNLYGLSVDGLSSGIYFIEGETSDGNHKKQAIIK